MGLAAFQKSYSEIFVSLTQLNGAQQWHRLQRLDELGALVENWLGDVFYDRVEEELDDPDDKSNQRLWSEACEKMCRNAEALNEILRTGAQDFVIINTPKLTEQEWDRLQLADNWKDQHAFKYWRRLTAQRSFSQMLDELQLSQEACKDMFFNNASEYRLWIKQCAPRYVMDQLGFFENAMEDLLDEWVTYASFKALFDEQSGVIGIPCYTKLADYRSCEPELAKDLRFLSLFEWFNTALLKRLAEKNVEVRPVPIRAKEYFAWLKEERCVSTPSARIVFATNKLRKDPNY